MDLQLNAKTALITGSSAGIGHAAAVALAGEGAHVIINGRDPARLEDAQSRLLAAAPDATVTTVAADLSTAEGAEAVIDAAPNVDILVNNAATFGPHPFPDIPDSEWDRFFQTNLMSGVRLSRHYLPAMLERNDNGRILFTASDAAVQAQADMLHYTVTKTAVLALSRGLAEMTRDTTVTVNAILPGPTATEGVAGVMDGIAEQTGMSHTDIETHLFNTAASSSLLQRLIRPEEIATLITYLASPHASATNGDAIRAEGGTLRSIV